MRFLGYDSKQQPITSSKRKRKTKLTLGSNIDFIKSKHCVESLYWKITSKVSFSLLEVDEEEVPPVVSNGLPPAD